MNDCIENSVLELAVITMEESGIQPIEGISFTDNLFSAKEGQINEERHHVLIKNYIMNLL